jgi:multimeric flavodoxin WrbA
MKRLIIVGSPRTEGKSAMLAEQLFEACIEECPEDEVFLAPVSTLDVSGCTACDWCRRHAHGELTDAEQAELDAEAVADAAQGGNGAKASDDAPKRPRHCAKRDDMDDVYPLLDDADELIVVSPVYFAGAPSQLKALLDRFQPYFWTKTRARKRPATLHVVGEGGDPHGFDPLVGSVRSAAAVAGFKLERVLDWVGKIADDYEITAEADEYEISGPVIRTYAPSGSAHAADATAAESFEGAEGAPANVYDYEDAWDASSAPRARQATGRPRLSLGENGSERQVIQLDEDGKRIDDARYGRKRAGERKGANAKRGTNGVQQRGNNPYAKGKGASAKSGSAGGQSRGGNGSKPKSGKPSKGGKSGGNGKSGKQGRRRG